MRNYVHNVWPHLERGGGMPDTPMQDAKGSSNPPVSPWVLRLIYSNRVASYYLGWALEVAARGRVVSTEGVPFSEILADLRDNPASVQHWHDLDGGDNPYKRAFYEMSEHVARGVVFVHGGTPKQRNRLTELMDMPAENPDRTMNEKALVVRRAPKDELETRGRTRKGQKIDTMHTRRLMVEQLEQLEASTGYTGIAAMEVLSERKAKEGKDWSVRKIRRAVECVNRERRGDEGEVA